MNEDGDEEEGGGLLSKLVEIVILPAVLRSLQKEWEPLRLAQTLALAQTVRSALLFEPSKGAWTAPSSSAKAALCDPLRSAALRRLREAADEPV